MGTEMPILTLSTISLATFYWKLYLIFGVDKNKHLIRVLTPIISQLVHWLLRLYHGHQQQQQQRIIVRRVNLRAASRVARKLIATQLRINWPLGRQAITKHSNETKLVAFTDRRRGASGELIIGLKPVIVGTLLPCTHRCYTTNITHALTMTDSFKLIRSLLTIKPKKWGQKSSHFYNLPPSPPPVSLFRYSAMGLKWTNVKIMQMVIFPIFYY